MPRAGPRSRRARPSGRRRSRGSVGAVKEVEAMHNGNRILFRLLCVLFLASGACKQKEAPPPAKTASAPATTPVAPPPAAPVPFKVVAVDLGKEINADKK